MGCGGDLLAPGPDVPPAPADEPPTLASMALLTKTSDTGTDPGEPGGGHDPAPGHGSGPDSETVSPDAPTRSHTARDVPHVDPPTVPGTPLTVHHPAAGLTPTPARPPVHPPTLPAGTATPPPAPH